MRPFRRILVVLLIGVLAIFIQGTVVRSLAPTSMIIPNLILITVAFLAFHEASVFGAILAFLLGLQFDLSSGVLLGPWAAASIIVFALLSLTSQHVFLESAFAVMTAVFFSSLVATAVFLIIVSQFSSHQSHGFGLNAWILVESLFTSFLAPIGFRLLKRVMR